MKPEQPRTYADLHEHLDVLRKEGLLLTIDRPIDKDSELHPLVRWQYVGGIEEHERKAFLFTNVVDARGRQVRISRRGWRLRRKPAHLLPWHARHAGGSAAAMGARAVAIRFRRVIVEDAPCHEIVLTGDALRGEGHGLDALPIPVSTPGFDSAPTLTATNVITKDPKSGIQNHGTYRAGLKAPDRLVVRMATRVGGAGGYRHYLKHQKRGDNDDAVRDRARRAAAGRVSSRRRSCRSTWTKSAWRADSRESRFASCGRRPSICSCPRKPRSSSKG